MEKHSDIYIKAKGLTTELLHKIEDFNDEDLLDIIESLETLMKKTDNFQKETLTYLVTGWWIHQCIRQNLKVE